MKSVLPTSTCGTHACGNHAHCSKGEEVHCLNRKLAATVNSGADTCEKSFHKSGHACAVITVISPLCLITPHTFNGTADSLYEYFTRAVNAQTFSLRSKHDDYCNTADSTIYKMIPYILQDFSMLVITCLKNQETLSSSYKYWHSLHQAKFVHSMETLASLTSLPYLSSF